MFNDEIAACKVNVCGCTVNVKYGEKLQIEPQLLPNAHVYFIDRIFSRTG